MWIQKLPPREAYADFTAARIIVVRTDVGLRQQPSRSTDNGGFCMYSQVFHAKKTRLKPGFNG